MYFSNILLLLAEMAVYFGAMLALFRARRVLGIGAFFCALGATHFLESYFAVTFYLRFPLGLALSPGSAVFFSGKLALLLLTYIREDGPIARQPLYGLLLGNFLIFILVALLVFDHVSLPLPRTLDVAFFSKLAALMVWGNLLMFAECAVMFVVYEQLSRTFATGIWLPVWITLLVALSIDQLGFFTALHLTFDIPFAAGIGGWLGKVVAAALYGAAIAWYLTHVEAMPVARRRSAAQVWELLTLRHRQAPPEPGARHDSVTGAFHRAQFERIGDHLLGLTRITGRPTSILLLQGAAVPAASQPFDDAAARRIAETVSEGVRRGDYVVRYGENAFVIFAPGAPHAAATQMASMLRHRVEAMADAEDEPGLWIGVATAPQDGERLADLMERAERRIQAAQAGSPGGGVGVLEG